MPSAEILVGAETAQGHRITRELRIAPSDLAELIVSLGGVKFWVVAIFPLYIGWVIAQPPGARHLYSDDLRPVLAILIVGPFLGTFTLLLNVYYDMGTTDRANPRKKYVQVVEELIGEGLMDRETIFLASWAFAAIGLLLAAYVSGNLVAFGAAATGPITSLVGPYAFLVLAFLLAVLSVAYSHPRVRWKGVAGADILTNMVGFGVLCPLAGWSLLRPLEEIPWWFVATLALFLGALYAPTTASDYAADKAYGIRTLAVRLGVGRALALGFVLEVGSVALLALGWSQRWFPFEPPAYGAMGPLWPFLVLAIVRRLHPSSDRRQDVVPRARPVPRAGLRCAPHALGVRRRPRAHAVGESRTFMCSAGMERGTARIRDARGLGAGAVGAAQGHQARARRRRGRRGNRRGRRFRSAAPAAASAPTRASGQAHLHAVPHGPVVESACWRAHARHGFPGVAGSHGHLAGFFSDGRLVPGTGLPVLAIRVKRDDAVFRAPTDVSLPAGSSAPGSCYPPVLHRGIPLASLGPCGLTSGVPHEGDDGDRGRHRRRDVREGGRGEQLGNPDRVPSADGRPRGDRAEACGLRRARGTPGVLGHDSDVRPRRDRRHAHGDVPATVPGTDRERIRTLDARGTSLANVADASFGTPQLMVNLTAPRFSRGRGGLERQAMEPKR